MSWGPYWMFFRCDMCNKNYRFTLEDMEYDNFGVCPICHKKGRLVAESKDRPDNAESYQVIDGK